MNTTIRSNGATLRRVGQVTLLFVLGIMGTRVLADTPPASDSVRVTVTDATTAAPLAGVTLLRLATTPDGPQTPAGTTDAAGHVILRLVPAARTGYLALCPGHAPAAFGFWGALPTAYVVALKPATRAGGRLVAADGRAAPAGTPVTVRVRLYDLLRPYNWQAELNIFEATLTAPTDADGRFGFDFTHDPTFNVETITATVAGANVDTGTIDAARPAYAALLNGTLVLKPGERVGRPLTQWKPLPPAAVLGPLAIRLHVVDAATGRPVLPLRVSPGGQLSPDQLKYTHAHQDITIDRPDITWQFTDGALGYFLRVRADGYGDQATRLVKTSEGAADITLRLTPPTRRVFTVLTPDGRPAAGARVFVSTPTCVLDVSFDRKPDDWDYTAPAGVTGADGTLNFAEPGEPYRLAIADASGWAEVNPAALAADTPVRLTPWSATTFHVYAGATALQGVAVEWQSDSQGSDCRISWTDRVETNAAGTATVGHLPAEQDHTVIGSVMRAATSADAGAPNWDYIEAQWRQDPGTAKDITLMTGPKTLRARLTEQPGYRWQSVRVSPMGRPIELPSGLDALSDDAREKAVEQAVAARGDEDPPVDRVEVSGRPTIDGSVGAIGLEPGTYRLMAYAATPPGTTLPPRVVDQYVVLTADGPAVTDLGVLKPHASDSPLTLGKPVPDLLARHADGTPFKLSDERGHWVLLDFWGTWCGFCVAEEPTLKDAYEGWAADGRLAIVGVSVDDTAQQVIDHVARNALPWTQVVLGNRAKTDIPQRFGVDGYPTMLLIAPDGTLAAADLGGNSIRVTLTEKLGPPAPPKNAK